MGVQRGRTAKTTPLMKGKGGDENEERNRVTKQPKYNSRWMKTNLMMNKAVKPNLLGISLATMHTSGKV